MDLENLARLAGVIALFISIATFAITRYERRRKLVIELIQGSYQDFTVTPSEALVDQDEAPNLIKIRVTNIGGVPVIVKPESFYIGGNGEKITVNDTDWLGLKSIPSPLSVGSSFEVACFEDAFEHLLNMNILAHYMREGEYENTRVPLVAGFTDHDNNSYETRHFNYYYAVNTLERNT
ncbi:hypothetical protein LGV61_12965 [Desulfurispirillum indicum]|uniref:hypothetical protein n=1 Tax=Desulfurispirillum indicum TaxID=936456 RepID=UPI001CF9EEB0|nr:hypothetical protein [Desulfurispirillum indicum]UCZ56622.1 hypothetical protein LGV61_12965 [Desulfurispirillum indicum]